MTPPVGSTTGPGSIYYSGVDSNESTDKSPQTQSPADSDPDSPPFSSGSDSERPSTPLSDPLTKNAVLDQLMGGDTDDKAIPLDNPYVRADDGGGTLKIPGKQTTNVSGDVNTLLANGAKSKDAATKKEFTDAQNAIAKGDYATAYQNLDKLLRAQGEDVLSEADVASTTTVKNQLGFLAEMQKAGIKADYPPTESQLVDYFKTLKNNPAAARQAFENYTQNFHVHPINVKGADFDIKYSHDKVPYGPDRTEYPVDVPKDWSSVANRPVSVKDYPGYIGKQMNDCKGYGYMAEKLLGAAGFKVAEHVGAFPGPHDAGHEMVMFTHPGEKGYTLTSNDKTFQGNNQKDLAKQGFASAAGNENVTGKEHFYTGKTAAEAEIQMAVKDKEL